MSAYVVTDETISAIVKGFEMYKVEFRGEGYCRPRSFFVDLDEVRQQIGQTLLEQNYKSVNYRYDNDEKAPRFRYKDVKVDVGVIFGCIQNYDYQACETPDYYNSRLRGSLESLKDAMLKSLIKQQGMKCPYGYDGHDMCEY